MNDYFKLSRKDAEHVLNVLTEYSQILQHCIERGLPNVSRDYCTTELFKTWAITIDLTVFLKS